MPGTINIVVGVDVIAALSRRSLGGNVLMMDDGPVPGLNQGTSQLITFCWPGWLINWTVQQVDVQTPALIKGIRFQCAGPEGKIGAVWWAPADVLSTLVWSGVVPWWLVPGYRYRYEILVQMATGRNSVLSLDTASLVVPLPCG